MTILQQSLSLQPYLTEIKRKIHQNPELGMAEFQTTALVKSELEAMGVAIHPLSGEVGALGILEGTAPGSGTPQVLGLRADMDALPIQETADVPDRSVVPGVMHACGHDCHTAMLLGAARLLSSMRDRFSGTVKFIFQPAEETLGGSDYMIDQGVLENPKVDCIISLHGHSGYRLGEIALREGPYMASSDFFTATLIGQAGHGAYPHRVGCDPILAASNSVMALQSIVTRQIDATDPIVISVCEIHGGTAKNIIPEKVRFGGSIRCQTPATRNSIEERIRKVLQGVAASYNCTAELDYHYGVPPLVNSPDLMQAVWETASRVVGPENVKRIDIPAMGSEDFSAYLERAPRGFFVRLGIQPPDRAHILFHNGNFVFPEEALPYGTAFFTQFVLDQNGGSGRE